MDAVDCSPRIGSRGSVLLENAPLINDRRIVKTHLATDLRPYSSEAKFIYVARHPAACLASAIDFISMLMGVMALAQIARFPEVELTEEELANAVEKSRYKYMKDNENLFEMSPPTPMTVGSQTR
jgi:hypothetical protein